MELTKEQKEMAAVVEKCWEDGNFKQQLMANPIQTIENFKGSPLNIPEGVNFIVSDQTDSSNVYFNIPAKPNLEDVELTDNQLEQIAGGEVGDWWWRAKFAAGYWWATGEII